MVQTLPLVLQEVLDSSTDPDTLFTALLPVLGEVLRCDRCFLYLRDPHTRLGRVPYCWRRNEEVPLVWDAEWKPEPDSLPDEDPMFAAALRTEASIFVEDVQTASPEVVNLAFEEREFGHRALVHAHLCQGGLLWGVLQPAIFGRPRTWSTFDRSVVHEVEQRITPLVVTYVKTASV